MSSEFKRYVANTLKRSTVAQDVYWLEGWKGEISIQLRMIREKKGLSQKDVAEKLGISQAAVAKLEAGANMTLETLWKLSRVLGVDVTIFNCSIFAEKNRMDEIMAQADVPVAKTKTRKLLSLPRILRPQKA